MRTSNQIVDEVTKLVRSHPKVPWDKLAFPVTEQEYRMLEKNVMEYRAYLFGPPQVRSPGVKDIKIHGILIVKI
jgi:hypothetical protein